MALRKKSKKKGTRTIFVECFSVRLLQYSVHFSNCSFQHDARLIFLSLFARTKHHGKLKKLKLVTPCAQSSRRFNETLDRARVTPYYLDDVHKS